MKLVAFDGGEAFGCEMVCDADALDEAKQAEKALERALKELRDAQRERHRLRALLEEAEARLAELSIVYDVIDRKRKEAREAYLATLRPAAEARPGIAKGT